MLHVTAQRTVTRPMHQVFTMEVKIAGFDKLTPKAARAALEVAFGSSTYGTVWGDGYGYRIYEKSARKIYQEG